jgi:OmpA-OmpF porin, OOP family
VTYVRRIATAVAIVFVFTLSGSEIAQAQALFRLFFPHEQHDLAPDSADMVRQIVAYAGSANFRIATIDIVGHADTSEPDPIGLSTIRAQAVAAALQGGGLSPSIGLTVRGAGISEPYVPTADGVAEPLNRFASVVIN